LKITITGPESTGKTTLAKALAKQLDAHYVMEYAREHMESSGPEYSYDDLLTFAERQNQLIINASSLNNKLVIDTDVITIKIWSQIKFGKYEKALDQMIIDSKADLYLLCFPDLIWEEDPLRSNPNDRHDLFKVYENELYNLGMKYAIITGEDEIRLNNAILNINHMKF